MHDDQGNGAGTLADCVSPDELTRTALRLMVLTLNKGLYRAAPRLRKSPEAQRASQAIFAMNDFLLHRYSPAALELELRNLSAALMPLATVQRCDPFHLHLLATGVSRPRRKSTAPALRV